MVADEPWLEFKAGWGFPLQGSGALAVFKLRQKCETALYEAILHFQPVFGAQKRYSIVATVCLFQGNKKAVHKVISLHAVKGAYSAH